MSELAKVLARMLGRVEPTAAAEIEKGVEALFAELALGHVSLDGTASAEAKSIIRSLKRAR